MNWSNVWQFISPIYGAVVTMVLAYVVSQFKKMRENSKAEHDALGARL